MTAAASHSRGVGEWAVFDRYKRRWLRGLTGLVVAYALIVQGFLAISAAAQSPASSADTLFVICSHDGAGAAQDDGSPVRPDIHCPLCTPAVCGFALAPAVVSVAVRLGGFAAPVSYASAEADVSPANPRAGQSRAPPQNA
jgi:hypothetical protein